MKGKNTMKKIVSLVLALALVLSVASVAMAFTWGAGSSSSSNFADRYKIEVVKLAKETGIVGSSRLLEAPGATAVNSAPVYFYIRLTIAGSKSTPDDVETNAKAEVSITSLGNVSGTTSPINLSGKGNGVYYYNGTTFVAITGSNTVTNEAVCLDTATAKVSAKVYSKSDLSTALESGDYTINASSSTAVVISDGTNTVSFARKASNGKVTGVTVASGTDAQFAPKLYTYLGITASDISDGKVYMSDDNIRAAFGFDYKGEASITWTANSTPIILDPNVGIGIPKTGDNTSVIGFAMVMIAIVAGAVAVKKVKA